MDPEELDSQTSMFESEMDSSLLGHTYEDEDNESNSSKNEGEE